MRDDVHHPAERGIDVVGLRLHASEPRTDVAPVQVVHSRVDLPWNSGESDDARRPEKLEQPAPLARCAREQRNDHADVDRNVVEGAVLFDGQRRRQQESRQRELVAQALRSPPHQHESSGRPDDRERNVGVRRQQMMRRSRHRNEPRQTECKREIGHERP